MVTVSQEKARISPQPRAVSNGASLLMILAVKLRRVPCHDIEVVNSKLAGIYMFIKNVIALVPYRTLSDILDDERVQCAANGKYKSVLIQRVFCFQRANRHKQPIWISVRNNPQLR